MDPQPTLEPGTFDQDEVYPARSPSFDIDGMEENGQKTPLGTSHGEHQRTAFYDYMTEKSASQADAKLFYQRHRWEQDNAQAVQSTDDLIPPLSPSVSTRSRKVVDRRNTAASAPRDGVATPPSADLCPHEDPNTFHQGGDESYARTGSNRQQPQHLHSQGVHGGAAVAPSLEMPAFAGNGVGVASELNSIYTNIQRILDLRHKYIRLSLQQPGDNPKDDQNWPIYPPPPQPVWDEENNRPLDNAGSGNKWRKPGCDIGEDFDMDEMLPFPGESEMAYRLDDHGVFQVYETAKSMEFETPILYIPTIRDYYIDLDTILSVSSDGPTKSFAFRRLQYLEGKYNLYFLLNEYQETAYSKRVPHRDFYNVRKVDTHVHHSSCMNQKHLLRFIKSKMKKSPDEIVMFRDGKHLTLAEVFESINLTAYDLSIDTLDMHVSVRVPKYTTLVDSHAGPHRLIPPLR